MRCFLVLTCALAVLALAPALGWAQATTGSAGLGVGIVDDSPASVVEAGLDVAGDDYAFGLGARVALLASGELRREDWDQPGEWATVIRYARYHRPAEDDEWQLSAAAGQLSDARLGHGALVDGYSSGVDIDHHHLGVHARAFGDRAGGAILVDDIARPRIIAGQGSYRPWRQLFVTASLAGDVSAPESMGSSALFGSAVDVTLAARNRLRPWWVEGYGELAAWLGLGAGAHLGARAGGRIGAWEMSGSAEGQVGTSGYVAGYIDGLYERQRWDVGTGQSLRERADAGELGGVGGLVRARVRRRGLGTIEAAVGHRAGLGARAEASVISAERMRLQLGARTSYQASPGEDSWIAAAEVRVRLPAHLFATLEAARLYRRQRMDIRPAYWMLATLGAVLGE